MSQYFTLFQLPVSYTINLAALEQNYRTLAAQFHPDKYTTANPFEQKQALMMSATINQAYTTLQSPIDRAAYILQQHNIHPDDPHNTQIDPEFLMQQMQWRETLAETLAEAQAEQNTPALQALQTEIAQAQTQLEQQLATTFAQQDYPTASDLVRQGRFLNKLQREIQNALD